MQRTVLIFLASTQLAAADLPVRDVVLYKSGVGYFERAGTLAPGESARLNFEASEMNDVLKSLTLTDMSGAKVTGLRYDSSDPLSHKLAELPFRLGDQQGLPAFLDQMKGARLEVKLGAETLTGSIVGARTVAGDEKRPPQDQATLLTSDGQLRTVDLAAASSVRFLDAETQRQLAAYLTAVAQSRVKEKRSVYIDSTGGARRSLVASYMIATPVWKSSYRLIFPEAGEPTLEGWAIVDNTSSEDWNNVRLSLVSGRPISFISRLYEPQYRQRPTADLPEDVAVGPTVYEGELEQQTSRAKPAPPSPPAPAAAVPAYRGRNIASGPSIGAGGYRKTEALAEVQQSSVSETATGTVVGELFEYRFGTSVTVKQGESAMLPFLQQKLNARKLLIYSGESDTHPRNAAELINNTGKTLDGGPITVFDAGAYAGEGLVETVKANDKRLIGYAVDLGTRVSTRYESKAAVVREMHLTRGVLTTHSAVQETRTYTIRNVDQKAKTLVIQHASRPGYTLLSTTPAAKTDAAYRFEVKLGPDSTAQFPVSEERILQDTVLMSNLTPDMLLTYVNNKALSAQARQQLQQILALKQQIVTNDRDIMQTEADIRNLNTDQDRIRQNISSLNQVAGQQEQVQKYARALSDQEARLASLRDRERELQQRKRTLSAQLDDLIGKAEF